MSYDSQAQLEGDPVFQRRNRASAQQQATVYKDDQRPSWSALAKDVLRGEGVWMSFASLAAAGPGIADKVEQPNGIDQNLVTDADLLSLTQANWPTIADLYYNADGTPIGG